MGGTRNARGLTIRGPGYTVLALLWERTFDLRLLLLTGAGEIF